MAEETSKNSRTNSPLGTLMVALLVGAAFIIGTLYSRVQSLEQQVGTAVPGTGTGATAQAGAQAANAGVAQPTQPPLSIDAVAPVTQEDHIQGSLNAPVTIIEYSDPDCPFCAQFHPTMERIVEEYPDQVAWVYRHFPIPQLHPGAELEAEAIECVAAQGGEEAFWTYLGDVIQETLDEAGLVALASQQGYSIQSCLDNDEQLATVQNHFQTGVDAGVQGTPSAFVITQDGQIESIPGALPYAQVKSIVDKYI